MYMQIILGLETVPKGYIFEKLCAYYMCDYCVDINSSFVFSKVGTYRT
jgi:hypothetical protein